MDTFLWQIEKANIGTTLYHNVRVMSEAHRPVEHFLQRRGLSEKAIIEMQNLVDTQLIHQLHVFDHLVQRREPSPVGSSLTNAVCRFIAHQDPRGGRVPWIHKLVSQTSASKNVKLFRSSPTQPRWWSPGGWIVVTFPMQVWQVENNRLAWIQQWLVPSKNLFG